jgi:hypothetical protein
VLLRERFAGLAAAMAVVVGIGGCSGSPQAPVAGPTGTVVTSTTKIASAGVLGNQRLTPGGNIKRAKPKPQTSIKKRSQT